MTRLGMPVGPVRGGRCLGDRVTAYADRAMDDASLLHWDRHLVACTSCRALVDEERRVLAALRSPTSAGVPGDLRSMLLAVAAEVGACAPTTRDGSPGRHRSGPAVPPVPVAPVPVVDRGTPALHRSVRRATVFAGIAAGATAAAAWSVAVTGGALTPTAPPSPAVQRTRPVQTGTLNATYVVHRVGATLRATPTATATPAGSVAGRRSAQSTP